MSLDPHKTYQQAQVSGLDGAEPRMVEAWALSQLAVRLETAWNEGKANRDDMLDVIRLNWQVWTIIQAWLVDDECDLATEIRENLLGLTNFIDKQSVRIIGRGDLTTVPTLININRQISAGLMGDPGEGVAGAVGDSAAAPAAPAAPSAAPAAPAAPSAAPSGPGSASSLGGGKYGFVRIKGQV